MVGVSLPFFFFNLLDAVVVRCMSGVMLHSLNTFENQHSLVAQAARNLPAVWETWVRSLGWEDPWRRKWLPTPYSCLENFMDSGAWQGAVHGVSKSRTQLSN